MKGPQGQRSLCYLLTIFLSVGGWHEEAFHSNPVALVKSFENLWLTSIHLVLKCQSSTYHIINYPELGKQISSKKKLINLLRNGDRITFNYGSRNCPTDTGKKSPTFTFTAPKENSFRVYLTYNHREKPFSTISVTEITFSFFQTYIMFLF